MKPIYNLKTPERYTIGGSADLEKLSQIYKNSCKFFNDHEFRWRTIENMQKLREQHGELWPNFLDINNEHTE